MPKRKAQSKTLGTARLPYDASSFSGLNIHPDSDRPTVRNVPLPSDTEPRHQKRLLRETEGKRLNDMERLVHRFIATAIANKRTLPFRMSELVRLRQKNQIPISGGCPFPELQNSPVELRSTGKAVLLVDLDNVVVLWYFPSFIGTGLQKNILSTLRQLVAVCPPRLDGERDDRRSNFKQPVVGLASSAPVTRQRARERADPQGVDHFPDTSGRDYSSQENELSGTHEATSRMSNQSPMDAGSNGDAEKNYPTGRRPGIDSLDPGVMPAAAFYFSPGWFGTGMENKYPMQASSDFRALLGDGCREQAMAFLEAKRLLDIQVAYLTDIIHTSLAGSMRTLRTSMMRDPGFVGLAAQNGWTSAFPCFGVGINRTTPVHRDIKGLSAGMDVIGVLGTFDHGGDLTLPDLNLTIEWRPGCLGAFDGYDLRHGVKNWSGGSRATLISFCRSSTWRGLGLAPEITRPTLKEVQVSLEASILERQKAQVERNAMRSSS